MSSMVSTNNTKGSKSLKDFKDLIKGNVPKGIDISVDKINFKGIGKYKSKLLGKHKADKRVGTSNVYKIDDSMLMIEFTHISLPVCLLVGCNTDGFDVACDKLQTAFSSGVGNAMFIVESLGYFNRGVTYNTLDGVGTFCTEDTEVIESFLNTYKKVESDKGLRKCLIDSGLYKYATPYGLVFGATFEVVGDKPYLRLGIWLDVRDRDAARELVHTIKSTDGIDMDIIGDSLHVKLLLRG